MREYTSGYWGFGLVWGLRASVFPRAFALALPNALLAFIIGTLVEKSDDHSDEAKTALGITGAFTTVLFFVLGFRSNVAYSRWWEGGTLLQQTRGEWFNAYSSLIAFSSTDPSKEEHVEAFHHMLARFMSLLFCAALQQVAPEGNERVFEILDPEGIDPTSMEFLQKSPDKVEVILQWIQRTTILNMGTGVLPIPPPVMSRAFQEISRGIVNLQNARKIADFPFPFPYAQVSVSMLLIHWFLFPAVAGMLLDRYLAFCVSFSVIFFLWCINYIALCLENPFGDKDNDLPMAQMQSDWNNSIGTLLAKRAQHPPKFVFDAEYHRQLRISHSNGSGKTVRRLSISSKLNGATRRRPSSAGSDSELSQPSHVSSPATSPRASPVAEMTLPPPPPVPPNKKEPSAPAAPPPQPSRSQPPPEVVTSGQQQEHKQLGRQPNPGTQNDAGPDAKAASPDARLQPPYGLAPPLNPQEGDPGARARIVGQANTDGGPGRPDGDGVDAPSDVPPASMSCRLGVREQAQDRPLSWPGKDSLALSAISELQPEPQPVMEHSGNSAAPSPTGGGRGSSAGDGPHAQPTQNATNPSPKATESASGGVNNSPNSALTAEPPLSSKDVGLSLEQRV